MTACPICRQPVTDDDSTIIVHLDPSGERRIAHQGCARNRILRQEFAGIPVRMNLPAPGASP